MAVLRGPLRQIPKFKYNNTNSNTKISQRHLEGFDFILMQIFNNHFFWEYLSRVFSAVIQKPKKRKVSMKAVAFQEQAIKFISKRTSKSHLHTLKSFHVHFKNLNTHTRTKAETAPNFCPDFKACMCSVEVCGECIPSFCWTRAFHDCLCACPSETPTQCRKVGNYWPCWYSV